MQLPLRLLSALISALLLAGCNGQNPACVFGPGNCQGGSGGTTGALGSVAILPLPGDLVLDGPPGFQAMFPSTGAALTTPIVLTFSESLAPDSLSGSIVIQGGQDLTGFGAVPVLATINLVGDGRVVVLLPAVPLDAGTTYEVRLAPDAKISDITGQVLSGPAGGLFGTFSTAATDPESVQLVTSFPAAGSSAASTTPELVVVFDRSVLQTDVDDDSFVVLVDGADPAFDPEPAALQLSGLLPIPDTRVFTYRSVDEVGMPVSLGAAAQVELTLSPESAPIGAQGADPLTPTVISFQTDVLEAPTGSALTSAPSDAIGIANLLPGSSALSVQVELQGGQAGDRLGAFLFGTSVGPSGSLVAVLREVQLSGETPIEVVDMGLEVLELAQDGAPIFADGSVAFAFRLRRGSSVTPLSVLDVNLGLADIQDPILDTVRPSLLTLTHPGDGGQQYRSDLPDLTIAGVASEELAAADVVTALGDNRFVPEAPAPVIGSQADGSFLARAVPLGASGLLSEVDLPLPFDLTLYDRALNASEVGLGGEFTQLGQVGPEELVPGGTILVRVYDSESLEPVAGAAVMTHSDTPGAPLVPGSVTTSDEDGEALTLPAADGGRTLLSVSAAGFDNFTFHGLEAGRISVPLAPSAPQGALAGALISSQDPVASGLLPLLDVLTGDTRRLEEAGPSLTSDPCSANPFGGQLSTDCPLVPVPVRPGRVGAATVIVGEFGLSEVLFAAPVVLQAFELFVPLSGVASGSTEDLVLPLNSLLSSPGVEAEELPAELPFLRMDATLTIGLDLDSLVNDPLFTGEPTVSVEGLLPGLTTPVVLARGLGFPLGNPANRQWLVRTAAPGASLAGGRLVESGALDPDIAIRIELTDGLGNRAGQRTRLSRLEDFVFSAPDLPTVFPAGVPRLLSPAPGSSTGGASFDIEIDDTLLGTIQGVASQDGQVGLFRVSLRDSAGKGWQLWALDQKIGVLPDDIVGGAAPLTIALHVPDVSEGGGAPLADGELEVRIATFAWPTFDKTAFSFGALEREYEAFSFSAPLSLIQD